MALIICPECGKEVSSTAMSCPHCGMILKKDRTIRVQFPQKFTVLQSCKVYDENGEVLATCQQGGVASFETDKEEIFIKCKIPGYFGAGEIMAKPGDRLVVSQNLFGFLKVSRF